MTTTTDQKALRSRTWQGPGLPNPPFSGGRPTNGDAYKLVSTDAKSGWNRPRRPTRKEIEVHFTRATPTGCSWPNSTKTEWRSPREGDARRHLMR